MPGPLVIPAPSVSFNAGTGTANPPDPVGDVGPNHYVRMSNASFQIFNKTGTSVFGPANINTLFTGFGAPCETESAGDPIVLYDQIADRWLLTQFSDGTGPAFVNCVALSQTSDPTGTYYRWAFATAVFPDYPKYGIWPIATSREAATAAVPCSNPKAVSRDTALAVYGTRRPDATADDDGAWRSFFGETGPRSTDPGLHRMRAFAARSRSGPSR